MRAHFAIAAATLAAFLAGCAPAPQGFSSWRRPASSRIAILPLANYTPTRDAPDRLAPILAAEFGRLAGVEVIDMGVVDAALADDPWLLTDRIPPDLADRFAKDLGADALLVGSVLGFGNRDIGGEQVPQVSISLRLIETPGSRVLWTVVHSRDGEDSEWLFGFGRVRSLEQLAACVVHDALATFPARSAAGESRRTAVAEGDSR
ncbi:MAG: hypothetical protein ACKVU1_17275 [bacterium]